MKSGGVGFWARIALRFLVRSGRSTVPLSLMVITAVAALVFLSALAVGVNDAMLRNTVGLFSGHIDGYGLDASVRPADLAVPGVKGVLKRIWVPGVISAILSLSLTWPCSLALRLVISAGAAMYKIHTLTNME